jgi:hypothetical protein
MGKRRFWCCLNQLLIAILAPSCCTTFPDSNIRHQACLKRSYVHSGMGCPEI